MSTTQASNQHTVIGPRGRRIALIDRPWIGYRSVMLATPLAVSTAEEIRRVLADQLSDHPSAPLSGRIDERAGRWVPVPRAERAAHLDRVLISSGDLEPDGIEAHVGAHVAAAASDLPFVVVVGTRSICVFMSHAVGDATVLSRLMLALARADRRGLDAIASRAGTTTPLRALVRQVRPHHRQWLEQLRHPAAPPALGTPDPAEPATPPRPAFAGAVLGGPALRDLTRWRNANAPGVSLTSVLTSATYRALTEQGLNIHGGGCYTLVDIRSQLPKTEELPYGNLAKSLYLAADLSDPKVVAVAMREAVDSARAIPAIVVATATSPLRGPVLAQPHPRGAPLMFTMNSMPTLPGLSDLPWAGDSSGRRFFGVGLSAGPGGITVFALRMRDHMQLTASFDETTAAPDAVRGALETLADPASLMGRRLGSA
ncbi:MAG TPA: hypothetical protein VHW44_22985 [Pseudonocardiaceae bacterium]|jgi:hypothetical protein|nr:hypothetical protein [Pseudonocardiaceae bacterium]